MDFSQIALPRKERLLLWSDHPIPVDACPTLIRLKFAEEQAKPQSRGGMPVKTGYCTITDLGRDYLRYYRSDVRRKFSIPIATAVATELLLHGAPRLWHLIQVWVSSLPSS